MISIKKFIGEAIGWAGALFSLSAFSMNSMNVIGSQSIEYLSLNIAGSVCLIAYAIYKKAHASWVLNSIWLVMTAFAFIKVYMGL